MAEIDARTLPLDQTSTDELAAAGLEYALVDGATFDPFLRAVSRGFLDSEPTDDQIADSRDALQNRRMTGVFDRSGFHPERPVGTVDSWVTELTTEPGHTLPLWAISAVTVAPTHRRRGIARVMLAGELRTARDAGLAIAGLTVSEATIYGRWGFSPAVYTADWRIDSSRVRWTGPTPAGRLDFLEQSEIPDRLGALHDRTRLARPGQVAGWPGLWRRTAGLRPGADDAKKVRAVAYRDESGVERGLLVYTIKERDEYNRAELIVHQLVADGDDAYAALWRFAIEHDLVGTVIASLQTVDAPVRWMLSDQRAAKVTVTDHHWLRILDVPAALSSRSYAAPLDVTLQVTDPLGFATGRWRWRVDADGAARVEPAEASEADVEITVGGLSSILLGGVPAASLRSAGIVTGEAPVIAALDAALTPQATPLLDIWY
jgi:predicted acetyltransferase